MFLLAALHRLLAVLVCIAVFLSTAAQGVTSIDHLPILLGLPRRPARTYRPRHAPTHSQCAPKHCRHLQALTSRCLSRVGSLPVQWLARTPQLANHVHCSMKVQLATEGSVTMFVVGPARVRCVCAPLTRVRYTPCVLSDIAPGISPLSHTSPLTHMHFEQPHAGNCGCCFETVVLLCGWSSSMVFPVHLASTLSRACTCNQHVLTTNMHQRPLHNPSPCLSLWGRGNRHFENKKKSTFFFGPLSWGYGLKIWGLANVFEDKLYCTRMFRRQSICHKGSPGEVTQGAHFTIDLSTRGAYSFAVIIYIFCLMFWMSCCVPRVP